METLSIYPLKQKASRICLGTWAMGGWMWGGSEEKDSIATIHAAFDHGINFIDTAPVYGFGVAESIVGKAVSQSGQRENILLATKCGLDWKDPKKITRNSTPIHLQNEIEASLKRLKTDYIDIYQIHWPDLATPFEQTARVMEELLHQGKIRAIGVSNFSPKEIASFMQYASIHTSQPPYNLFEREIEQHTLPYTEQHQIVSLCYGALCRGLLSGKMHFNTTFKNDDLRQHDPKFQPPRYASYLQAVSELDAYAQNKFSKNVLALAVRWILDQGKTIALWGARHPNQINSVQNVMEWKLDEQSMLDIDAIILRHVKNPIGPEFMAPPKSSVELI